jgi:Cu/Ag efflux protein CusF
MTRSSIRNALGTAALAGIILAPAVLQADHHGGAAEASEPAAREVVVGEAIQVTAKVIEIDAEARVVTVEGEAIGRVPIKAPEPAPNFDQISVGDDVTISYYESVALELRPATGAEPAVAAAKAVALAPRGATPGGLIVETVQRTAVIRAIDEESRKVQLDVPAGYSVTLRVSEDVDLAGVQVGEKVIATHTQAVAIELTKP